MTRTPVATLLAILLVLAACSDDTSPDDEATTDSPTSVAADTTTTTADTTTTAGTTTTAAALAPLATPAEVTEHGADWVLPGRDYDNSRATTESPIDSSNVAGLEVAWEAELTGPLSTVPLIVDDRIYVQDGTGVISAIDTATGDVVWATEPYGFNIGPFGVALADGRLFGVYDSTGIVAVDAATGEELWRTSITSTSTEGVDIQPVAYGGLVFASSVPVSVSGIYTGGDRGVLHALDAETGEVVWTFDTVAADDGSPTDDIWGDPEVNSGGGAWYPPSIDVERGLVYWGIANPAPFPGTPEFPNGSSRPGPNLFTDSIVALHIETGELAWYHQVTPHDIFDRDLIHTLIARPESGPVVVTTGKAGLVVGLDPDTHEPLWETPVGRHENDDLTELEGPTLIYPGTFGGVITPPSTADGVVYVAALNAPTELSPDQPAYIGSELGTADGEVAAIDAETGDVLWATTVPGDPLGATTVVNDLVFTAVLSGEVLALDRATGEIVWQTSAPGGINGWMSAAGGLIVVPVGNAGPPRLVAYHLPR